MTIKKITSLLILSVLPLGVLTAQEDKDYLPKAGDLAIGIDMQPVYSFFGNLANGDVGNGLGQFGGEDALGYTGISIMGKYMLDKTTALRVNLGVQKTVTNDYSYSPDDLARFLDPLSEADVTDCQHLNNALYSIAAGIEFRKGEKRLQGYAGADLVLGMRKRHYKFEYGNALTDINTPTRTNYNALGLGVVNPGYWTPGTAFITESYSNTIVLGAAGKLGVEYFVAPKISFGGEVSLFIGEEITKGRYTKSEGWNPTTSRVETHTELEAPADRVFHIGTEDMGGKLFMMFYF